MHILIIFAHPEPRSLSTSLRGIAVRQLEQDGHSVEISDLYAMNWKSNIDRLDFPSFDPKAPLMVPTASSEAFQSGTLTADIVAEQEKLRRADAVILQFPLWWFSMPAILKGWVERVYAYGFGYGVGEHTETRWGDRYGEGMLMGKRAMLVVTIGGWAEHYGPRGINGPIDDLLFPINHGILHYPGMDVLPPFVTYRTDRMNEARFQQASQELRQRMKGLFIDAPIAFRQQNGGDYHIPTMELRDGLERPGTKSFELHVGKP